MIITELESEQTKLLLKSPRVQPGTKVYETDTGCRILLSPPQEEYVNVHQNTFHLWQVVGKYREIDLLEKEAFA